MADISHYGPAAGDAASSPLYRALCVRSGNVIALGMQKSASVNCAGMALFRVFQGNVEVLGFRPPLGVYFSLHSPKWNNLLVIEGRPGNEETQAPFGPTNASLLQIMEPNLPAEAVNEDEEIAVDKLAMQLVDDFPIVLVLRAIPVTYGNVTSFYENTRPERPSAVLPGFKMIISKHNQNMLSELTAGFDYTSAAPPDADPSHHDWKSPERVLAELVVVDSVKTLNFTEPWQATVDRLEKSLVDENPQKIVVCGGKGVGKSTFCRYLVNRLLSKFGTVAFLDTDLGQNGWIKSMGHDLLCNVIQETNPDHVVQLLAATKNKQFVVPTEGRWRIHAVPPWDPLQNLQVLSEKNRVDSDIYRAYARLTPFAASFDHVDVAFAGSSVAPSQLLFSLNASVVGLCINPDYKAIESEPREGPPRIVLQPVHAPCLGVGIIRAVDAAKRQLFVVSPLPLSILKRINLLVRSSMPLDSILLSAQEPAQAPYVVTDVVASDGTGSAVMQSRNNLKRKRDGK
ncbi:Growth arrest-specific protein 8 [Phytophthora nicotianae]|uniref:Growth arrest-specific protein 8 n=1 Tax=Phytophthora nicotianae TaxID=4792 RepID=A0A0W8DNL7_PHYNI|nr:Growth arrest-specific protein 8 [Phytophthora nicotianae]